MIGRLWIVPPEPARSTINERWQAKYDAHYDRTDPHITLGSKLTKAGCDEMRPGLIDLLASVPPFEVCLDDVKESRHNQHTISLRLRNSRPVDDLQRLLEVSFPELVTTESDFVAHLTIGWFSEPHTRDSAVTAVREELEEIEFVVTHVSFVSLGDDEIWRVMEDIVLEG